MLKVLKNLKNSWVSVLVIIILLCVQAVTDLALPDYTSKIVNVGIQYGGIEEVAPEVIAEEVYFADSKREDGQATTFTGDNTTSFEASADDDLPF